MAEQQKEEKDRKRSPNFSYASVRDCIRYLTALEAQVHQGKVPILIAFDHMGLNRGSSSTDRIRASMSNYKLTTEEVVGKEKYLRLTDLSYQIIIDTRQEKRLARCREAALNDPMTKKVWEAEWKRGLPNDDAVIISVLRADYKFQEESAKRFATVLKDNYQFCQLATYFETPAESTEDGKNPPPDPSHGIPSGMNPPPNPPSPPKGFEEYTLTLSKTKEVKLYTSDSLTKDDIDFMVMWIKRLDLERANLASNQEAGKNEQG